MTVCRVIPFVAMLVAVALPADAQFEGIPDLPAELSLACQHLLALRDQTQRHEQAIQKANQRKASVQETCPLYRIFIIKETQLIRGIEVIGQACGVPSDFLKQIRDSHAKALEIGKGHLRSGGSKEVAARGLLGVLQARPLARPLSTFRRTSGSGPSATWLYVR